MKARPAATATATGSPSSVMTLAAAGSLASRIDTAPSGGCVRTSLPPTGSAAISPVRLQVSVIGCVAAVGRPSMPGARGRVNTLASAPITRANLTIRVGRHIHVHRLDADTTGTGKAVEDEIPCAAEYSGFKSINLWVHPHTLVAGKRNLSRPARLGQKQLHAGDHPLERALTLDSDGERRIFPQHHVELEEHRHAAVEPDVQHRHQLSVDAVVHTRCAPVRDGGRQQLRGLGSIGI